MPTNNQQKPRRTAASTSIGSKGSLYLSERSRAELAVPLEHCLPDCSRMKMHVLITVFPLQRGKANLSEIAGVSASLKASISPSISLEISNPPLEPHPQEGGVEAMV